MEMVERDHYFTMFNKIGLCVELKIVGFLDGLNNFS
jgi:hypothetical protein